jgi:hypothetical protein
MTQRRIVPHNDTKTLEMVKAAHPYGGCRSTAGDVSGPTCLCSARVHYSVHGAMRPEGAAITL